MKRLSKNRILSLFLALTMIFTAMPISSVGANATEATPISILYNGQKVDNLVLMEDEKITLTTSASGSDSLSYRWQICVDEESDKWVNIKGYTKDFCIVSYALIGSLLDTNGSAYLRCKATDGANEYLSNTLTVNVSYNAPITYEKAEEISQASAPAMARYSLRTANNNVSLAADEELQSCTIVINYTYEDNSLAFEPFVATIEYGGAFNYTAVSPTVVGYAPYVLQGDTYVDAKNVELNYASLTKDKEIYVIYRPVPVDYTVLHYTQNILDDNYELHTETNGQQFTGSQVGKCDIDIDGFTALYYERLTVAADGSTVIEVYYDRNYYLVDFDLGGGYGVEPIYARYGATIGANDPTRAGYVFAGWELVGVDGVKPTETQKAKYDINDGKQIAIPQANLSYKALWTTQETTYTVVYWRENAEPNTNGKYEYSYWGSKEVTGIYSGSVVSGSDDVPNSVTTATINGETVNEKQYFTYNDILTDKNIIVEGDGSTVVNVYYTRNTYTLTFKATGECGLEEHTHGTNCNSTLICPIKEHTHNDSCEKSLNCALTEHTAHTSSCLKCGLAEHTAHTSDCLTCTKTECTSHTVSCYSDVGDKVIGWLQDSIGGEKVEGQVYKGLLSTYIYIGGSWYNYSGSTSSGSIAPRVCHTHTTSCYKDTIHTHSDTCYKDSLHTHTNSCYLYSCGSAEHTHTKDCYSECTKVVHTHGNNCTNANRQNTVYSITAKYQAEIKDEFAIKNTVGGDYTGYWWDDANNTVFSHWIVSLDTMPGANITFEGDYKGDNATIWYYTEVLPGDEYVSDLPGSDNRQYGLYKEVITVKSGHLTEDEEFHNIEGFSKGNFYPSNIFSSTQENNYLYYTRNSYTLKFYNYNEYLTDKQETVLYDAPISSYYFDELEYPSTLEPNAYEFKGWYTTPECFDGTECDFETQKMPAGDLTLYAKWAPVQHEVNIYLDATLSKRIGTTQLVDHKDLASAPDEAVENGNYTFAGWFYIDDDGTEKAFVFNSMPINQDLNIYAKWSSRVAVKYEVYYKLEGTNTQIADPTIGSTLAGMNKTFLAKGGADLYSDYQEGYFPTTNSHTVTMSVDGDNVFTFWYVEKKSVPYTVRYIDEATGEELLTTKSVTDNKKAVVTEVFEAISGYMPDAYQKRLVLSADNAEQNVITFYYTKDEQHAYYRIVHYVQNLSGNGYTEYRSIESVGTINDTYSAETLTISGFAFNGVKTEENNDATSVNGTTVSGTLTANGLLIELFYDRIEVNYTVKYLENSTNKVLATEKNESGIYGQQVSETYLDIDGYELIGTPTRTLTLAADSKRNVIKFYYQEKNVTIQYVPVSKDNGKVSIGSENVLVKSGTANGSTPIPNDGYKFVGWYLDESCTIPVDSSWIDSSTGKILPRKNADGLYEEDIYYAKFEYNLTSLKIAKQAAQGTTIDPSESFVFNVTDGNGLNMKVVVHGTDTVTIGGLTVGTKYTVTEDTSWSWRYEPTGGATKEITLTANVSENTVTFENSKNKTQWLDSETYAQNIYNGNGVVIEPETDAESSTKSES